MITFPINRSAMTLSLVAMAAIVQTSIAQVDQIWIGAPSTPLNWNTGSNWSPIASPPDVSNNQIGVINNGGVAFLDSAATFTTGGLELGRFDDPSGGEGTLEVRNGGSLVVSNNGTTNGALLVGTFQGGGFTGTLEVQPGGSVTADFMDIRGGDSSVTLGGTTAGTSSLMTDLTNVSNELRIVGPNVTYNTDLLQLFGGSTLVGEITGLPHSAINVNSVARLGGNVELDFNGYSPSVGDSWTLIQAGGIADNFNDFNVISDATLGSGQKFVLTKSSTQVNVSLENVLSLKVNRADGSASIDNDSPVSLGFTSYSIGSAGGALDPNGLQSLSSGTDPNFQEANPSVNQLGEINPFGSFSLGAADPVQSLGNAFGVNAPFGTPNTAAEDLVFTYQRETDGATMTGIVEYIGEASANNLVMTIDPSTGNAIVTNDSSTTVTIDGYTVSSDSNSLLTSWDSLDDQPAFPDWQEASPSIGRLSELNPIAASALTLSPGSTFELDGLWNTLGLQDPNDLAFSFRETTLGTIDGVVEFASGFEADFDNDGDVDGDDLAQWEGDFGVNGDSDADGDGFSTGLDFLVWQRQFGSGVTPVVATVSAVPEPSSSIVLLTLCTTSLALGRRRG